jgi:hypothetical protein
MTRLIRTSRTMLFAAALVLSAALPAVASADAPLSLDATLARAGGFDTYLKLRAVAGEGKGKAGGVRTWLVPTDESFKAWPDGKLDALLADPAQARRFLAALTLDGRHTSRELAGASPRKVRTAAGPATVRSIKGAPAPSAGSGSAEPAPIVVTIPMSLYIAPPPVVVTSNVPVIQPPMVIEPILLAGTGSIDIGGTTGGSTGGDAPAEPLVVTGGENIGFVPLNPPPTALSSYVPPPLPSDTSVSGGMLTVLFWLDPNSGF